MIKIKIVLCLLCFASLSLVAQTDDERKKIVESYNFVKINELKTELSNKYLMRESRISNYLKIYKTVKRKYDKNGKSHQVYDILDGKPIYITNDNITSAAATKTDRLHTGGSLGLNIDGQNMTIGMWEISYPLVTHVEFLDDQVIPQSRVTLVDLIGPPTIDNHSAHVAGTLIGNGTNPLAKGMAPKAIVNAYNAVNDESETLTAGSNGMLVSNHSYGVDPFNSDDMLVVPAANIGAYLTSSRDWDQMAYQTPYYLTVVSAGNRGGANPSSYTGNMAAGFDRLYGNKTSKNNLVVASTIPVVSSGVLISFIKSGFSSTGPTDDFRIKPDIAGDGDNVLSAFSSGINDYDNSSGTSMSSPNIAGSILLLQQYNNQINASFLKAATLKALVCHTAKDDVSKVGPDPIFGWGFLDTEKSALTITDASNELAVIKELTLNNSGTYTYHFSATAGSKLQATICWTDPAGPVQSNSLNSLTPRLVNDLDLRLQDQSATVFTPWKLDKTNAAAAAIKGDNDVDNIERIDITSPITGNYTLTVTHKGSLTNGSQPFSLIITGANLTLGVSNKLMSNVTVWPNPVNDKLNVSFKANGNNSKIRMYDIHGREVYKINLDTMGLNTNHEINTKAFYNGIYILNIQDGNAVYNKKIIIE